MKHDSGCTSRLRTHTRTANAANENRDIRIIDIVIIIETSALADGTRLGDEAAAQAKLHRAEVRLVHVAIAIEVSGAGRSGRGVHTRSV